MNLPINKFGAAQSELKSSLTWLDRIARTDLKIFPVPGLDLLLQKGFNPTIKGISLAPTPRHARVMLITGPLTKPLARCAANAYLQMPRPRILVFVDLDQVDQLPAPDISISSEEWNQLSERLRSLDIFGDHPEIFEPESQKNSEGNSGKPEGDSTHNHMDHGHSNHMKKDEGKSDNTGHGHENHGHDHSGGGFMSMVAMTKDLPRSADGLPMESNEVHFGPFHPGLPAGLSIKMTLDGDTVMKAECEKGLTSRHLLHHFPVKSGDFIDHLAGLDPLQPQAYTLLARLALSDRDHLQPGDVALLEKERVISHLHWLRLMTVTCGDAHLHRKVVKFLMEQPGEMSPTSMASFTRLFRKRPYLKTKLRYSAVIPENSLHHLTGPALRAAGKMEDTRLHHATAYRDFIPVVTEENNAWGQLLVRLGELEQSAAIISSPEAYYTEQSPFKQEASGTATLETAAGQTTLKIEHAGGMVHQAQLTTPARALAALVPVVSEGLELSDALTGIAALGISPYELDQ